MKKLFIITRGSIASQYGVGTYIQQLVNCFNEKEWKVTVVEVFALVKELICETKKGIVYYQIPVINSSGMVWDDGMTARYNRGVFYFLNTFIERGDVVYCHFNFVYEYDLARLFKEKLQAKIILTLHYMDWSFDLLGDREWLQRILQHPENEKDRWVVKRFEAEKKFMLDCCDQVIAIARHSYETLLSLYGIPESKLVYIPNALKDEYIERTEDKRRQLRQKYGFSEKEKLIIFAGRFNLVKGINELIEAFKSLLKEIPDCRLILAGDEGILNCFELAAPYWSRIVFTGFINRQQLFELYTISDVGVVPSIHEEFGYVALEMMMNNLPLVINGTTGLKELTEDGKFALLIDMSVKEHQIDLLKQAIMECFLSKKRNPGRERFKKEYSLDKFYQRIELLYHNLLIIK